MVWLGSLPAGNLQLLQEILLKIPHWKKILLLFEFTKMPIHGFNSVQIRKEVSLNRKYNTISPAILRENHLLLPLPAGSKKLIYFLWLGIGSSYLPYIRCVVTIDKIMPLTSVNLSSLKLKLFSWTKCDKTICKWIQFKLSDQTGSGPAWSTLCHSCIEL